MRTHAGQTRPVRRYLIDYASDPGNGVSLLQQVSIQGHDEQDQPVEELPPPSLGYTTFEPRQRSLIPVTGPDLPPISLAGPNVEQVELDGNALPDVVEQDGTIRCWPNLGHGQFDRPREMRDAPAGLALADTGVQLMDADGNGRADLLATMDGMAGNFPLRFSGQWDPSFTRYPVAPTINLPPATARGAALLLGMPVAAGDVQAAGEADGPGAGVQGTTLWTASEISATANYEPVAES